MFHRSQDSYLTLGRRVSLSRSANHAVVRNEPPPEYNTLEMTPHVPPSFITAELSDSDSDDDAGFLSEAPPDYNTLTTPNA